MPNVLRLTHGAQSSGDQSATAESQLIRVQPIGNRETL
jgi:hypothetical protein